MSLPSGPLHPAASLPASKGWCLRQSPTERLPAVGKNSWNFRNLFFVLDSPTRSIYASVPIIYIPLRLPENAIISQVSANNSQSCLFYYHQVIQLNQTIVTDTRAIMAGPRRSRTLPNDAAVARLLYSIVKQANLKGVSQDSRCLVQETDHELTLPFLSHQVDWQIIANELGINKGHAARMRFLRFKQQMEGIPKKPRHSSSPAKKDFGKKCQNRSLAIEQGGIHTKDDEEALQGVDVLSTIKKEPKVKLEAISESIPKVKMEAVEGFTTLWPIDDQELVVIDPMILGGAKEEQPMLQ